MKCCSFNSMNNSKERPQKAVVSFPTSVKEMHALGWDQPDVILFSGDAFVDHPAFGLRLSHVYWNVRIQSCNCASTQLAG